LIVFQLTISILFIIASLVTIQQLKFTRDKDLGFDSQSIIHIDLPGGPNLASNRLMMQNLNAIKGVEQTASQWLAPMSNNPRGMKLKILPADNKDFWVTQIAGDENFIPLYNIKIIAGRNLEKADSVKELVINEHLSGIAGFDSPMDAIGKILYWNDRPYPVVGVVRDFHTHSLHDPQTPLCIIHRPEREGTLAIKMELDKHASGLIVILKQIEQSWKSQFPGKDFHFRIFDQTLALLYEKDRQTGILMKTAMILALLISCMGLFGLSMFMAQKRNREMGIRKILGANVFNIITILSSDFLVLVLPAFLLASPLAWYIMNNWLQEFAYRIDMPWWVFIFAGMFVLVLTGLTVGIQAVKAVSVNLVNSLRME
jgi:putative ABC transport system permease protein